MSATICRNCGQEISQRGSDHFPADILWRHENGFVSCKNAKWGSMAQPQTWWSTLLRLNLTALAASDRVRRERRT